MDMKNLNLICVLLISLIAMGACKPKEETSYKELIVGKWEVKKYYTWYHDFTDESLSFEETTTLPDTSYQGYDMIMFNADGTSLWHMSDRYVQQGMFDNPYRTFNWQISEDSLIVQSEWKYAIKKLNTEDLVIEEYVNNGHEEYGHHHWEQIHRYNLERIK